jgi:hypothetical protein
MPRHRIQTARVTRRVGTLDYRFFKRGDLVHGWVTKEGNFRVTEAPFERTGLVINKGYYTIPV